MSDIERLRSEIFNGVLDNGHVVQFLPATAATPTPRAYTVGRTMVGRPEFIVAGLEKDDAHTLLDALVDRDITTPLGAGDELTISDLNVRLKQAEPMLAVGAYATFGPVTLLQAAWTDPAGRRIGYQPDMTVGKIPHAPTTDPYGDDD